LNEKGGDVARLMVIDDIHVTVLVPGDLPEPEAEAIRQVLITDASSPTSAVPSAMSSTVTAR
jgi:hypothetical protein